MTREKLEAKTKLELARLAKRQGLLDARDKSKADLIKYLARKFASAAKKVVKQSAPKPLPAVKLTKPASESKAKANGDHAAAVHRAVATLQRKNKRELEILAKKRGVIGWKAMRKEQIVVALSKIAAKAIGEKDTTKSGKTASRAHAVSGAARRIKLSSAKGLSKRKPMSNGAVTSSASRYLVAPGNKGALKDRIVAMVRDPFWLHVYWELTQAALQRTEAALGQDWYSAKPILRLLDVSAEDTTSASELAVRDVEIHGGVNNWYIDVPNPPRSFRVDIGYRTSRGRFFVLARSNVVTTPKPGASDHIDTHWQGVQDDSDRIYAMSGGSDPSTENVELRSIFEERLRRPMSMGTLGNYGSGALGNARRRGFRFDIDAELIVYGNTDPSARVTLQGEPVQLRPDGSFTLRFSLPDGRQILPAVAQTYDGIEERTIILAIERNTKELEPMIHDGQE